MSQIEQMNKENENLKSQMSQIEQMRNDTRTIKEEMSKMTKLACSENESLKLRIAQMNNIIEEKNSIIENLEKELQKKSDLHLEQSKSVISWRGIQFSPILGNRLETISDLVMDYYDNENTDLSKNNVYNKAIKEVKVIKSTQFQKDFRAETDRLNDYILTRLKKQIPSIKDDDLTWFAMLAVGLTPRAICFFLNMKASTLYSKRERMRTLIQNRKIQDKEEFMDILGK